MTSYSENELDGLSIPVFWVGRSVHMRVRTMSRTMSLAGTRTTTITATGVLPEWAIGIRRSPTGSLFERNVGAREESGAGTKLSKNDINEEDRDWDAENTATTVSLQEIGETRIVLENQASKA